MAEIDPVATFKDFQLACRETESRKAIENNEQLLIRYVTALQGEALDIVEMLKVLDPKLQELVTELLKASGNLVKHAQTTIFHRDDKAEENRKRAVDALARMLFCCSVVADVLKVPLSKVAGLAVYVPPQKAQ